ncbi:MULTISPECIES: ABC transporter ATP-binding protein [unclassified Devosia]|uniref:dipeptide ABC transporter ATP-binding protein n=1 Tax=unclassified Devosia TaxID=196773 RepID=UPI00086D7106|nr:MULTISPECIES: ABC transporter ATP-binding protein [unclassified Devosia]MBN9363445.1 ABC transporter ATP-binding protein [Devosia sp.]ODS82627.1 MAG: ABC transporter ATP-binding protein [Devosia sp. SCN 66-27]OJX25265.1 MAG: ABC transporter ATP-binding protein [Devosia sp. 66-14]
MSTPLLSVENLAVAYKEADRYARVTHDVSFTVEPGEVVALVGESGSGKTTTAQAVIGLLPDNGRIDHGAIRLNGEDISRWTGKRFDAIRGRQISLIPQDPTSSLNPVKTVGAQVGEILRIHGERDGKVIAARVIELLARVGLSDPELRARQYPHELSGGMKQRVLIAIAIALKPQLIIADEPTSALDVTVQRRILDLIDELRRDTGTAVLLVTHDLGVAADRADRIVVLQGGRIQEAGVARELLAAPQSAYARQLLADAPSLSAGTRGERSPHPLAVIPASEDAILVENLVHDFHADGRKTFRAVDDISFAVRRGTTHAIVGESGSGKTTTVRDVVGFGRPTSGRISIAGTDIATLTGEALRQFRQKIQLVYQNPFSSLDPRQTVFSIVEEPLRNFGRLDAAGRAKKVNALLERVGLPEALRQRRPRALSGGQRQRVAIARALVLDPEVVVLDEAVSALDVTVQAQILKLLDELQRERGLTYLFVSHDLAVVRQISDTVSVLQNGKQVETGPVAEVFRNPQSPYTRELIDAIPGQRSLAHV